MSFLQKSVLDLISNKAIIDFEKSVQVSKSTIYGGTVDMINNLQFLFSLASVRVQHNLCHLPRHGPFRLHLFTTLIIRFKAAQE